MSRTVKNKPTKSLKYLRDIRKWRKMKREPYTHVDQFKDW